MTDTDFNKTGDSAGTSTPFGERRRGEGFPGGDRRRGRGGRSHPHGGGRGLEAFFGRDLPELFEGVFGSFAPLEGPGLSIFDLNPEGFHPRSETYSEGEDYIILVELPGVKSEDLSVRLDNNRVVIEGEKKTERGSEEAKLREVRYGSFRRVYPVPAHTLAEAVEPSLKEGVLTVRVKGALRKEEGVTIPLRTK